MKILDTLIRALLRETIESDDSLSERSRKTQHEPGYKAPEGSARDRQLDAAKAAYKRGDIGASIRIRDRMEDKARKSPGFKTVKSKYTDETRQPADYPPVMSEYNMEYDGMSLEEQMLFEKIGAQTRKALKNKAEERNAPLGALITVYEKGLGAYYSSGSRPGMTSHQWAMRVPWEPARAPGFAQERSRQW